MSIHVTIPVRIEPPREGDYLAMCDVIQGCHAEGETVSEELEYIEDVPRVLFELQREGRLPLDKILEDVEPGAVFEAQLIQETRHP